MSHNMTTLSLSDKAPSIFGIISTDQYRKWFTTGNLFNAADTDENEPAHHYITLDLEACSDEAQSLVFMAERLAKSFSATVQPFDIIDALSSLTDSTDASVLLDKVTEMMFKLVNRTVIHLINDPAGYQFELSMPGMSVPKKVFTLWRLFEIASNFDCIGLSSAVGTLELGDHVNKVRDLHRKNLGLTPDQIDPSAVSENFRGLTNNHTFSREIKLREFSKDLIGVNKAIAQVISEREAYIEYSEGAIDASISAIIRTSIDPIDYMAALDEVCGGREMCNDAAIIIGLNLARVGAIKDNTNNWKMNGGFTVHHSISNLLREALLLVLPPVVNQELVLLEDAELNAVKP